MRERQTDRDKIVSLGGAEREREGDTESEAGSRLWAVSTEPYTGLELMNWEIMTWAEVGCLTNWATQAPRYFHFFKVISIPNVGLKLTTKIKSHTLYLLSQPGTPVFSFIKGKI